MLLCAMRRAHHTVLTCCAASELTLLTQLLNPMFPNRVYPQAYALATPIVPAWIITAVHRQ